MAETPQKCKPSGLSSWQVLLHDPRRNVRFCISKPKDSPSSKSSPENYFKPSRNCTQNMLIICGLFLPLKYKVSYKAKCSCQYFRWSAGDCLNCHDHNHRTIKGWNDDWNHLAQPQNDHQIKAVGHTINSDENTMFITSGVSAGQTIPHSVLCSCLGFASFPSLPIGEFRRLRWESVDAKVRRFNTWM